MTPEDRDLANTIMSAVQNQTDVLDSLVTEFKDRILKDGFRPHLTQFMQALQRLWNCNVRAPFTILSRMPDGIDYWEPSIEDGSVERSIAICLSLRNLVNRGLSEALYVFSGIMGDKANENCECVQVLWVCKRDSRHYAFLVVNGHAKQIMRMLLDMNSRLSPIFNPWNTNTELFEFLRIPESEHSHWDEFIAKGMEELGRVFELLELPEARSDKRDSHEPE